MWKGGVVVHIVAKSLLQYAPIDSWKPVGCIIGNLLVGIQLVVVTLFNSMWCTSGFYPGSSFILRSPSIISHHFHVNNIQVSCYTKSILKKNPKRPFSQGAFDPEIIEKNKTKHAKPDLKTVDQKPLWVLLHHWWASLCSVRLIFLI